MPINKRKNRFSVRKRRSIQREADHVSTLIERARSSYNTSTQEQTPPALVDSASKLPSRSRRRPPSKPNGTPKYPVEKWVDVVEANSRLRSAKSNRRCRIVQDDEDEDELGGNSKRAAQAKPSGKDNKHQNGATNDAQGFVPNPSLEDIKDRRRNPRVLEGDRNLHHERGRLQSHQDPKTKTREKRKRVEDDDHAPVVLVERPAKKFKQLTTRTRYISQDTMAEKWRPLPQAVQHQIREIFRAAKRQIILGKRDDRRRAEAEVVLASVVKRLDKMLPKMAVPQKTLEMHFNLDKLIERNVALDSQLTPAMHSVELLKSQIKEQEQLLNIDRQCLKRLKDDAREEELRQRSTTRGVHPAIKLPVDFEKGDDDPESISLVLSTPFADQVLEDEISYPELQSLLGQLRNHLESMQANMAQVDGIGDALISAHASLDGLLHTHASAAQYDQLTKV